MWKKEKGWDRKLAQFDWWKTETKLFKSADWGLEMSAIAWIRAIVCLNSRYGHFYRSRAAVIDKKRLVPLLRYLCESHWEAPFKGCLSKCFVYWWSQSKGRNEKIKDGSGLLSQTEMFRIDTRPASLHQIPGGVQSVARIRPPLLITTTSSNSMVTISEPWSNPYTRVTPKVMRAIFLKWKIL